MHSSSFKDQHIVITGGSGGIGMCLAQALAVRGARLTLVGRDAAKLQRARAHVQQHLLEAGVTTELRAPEQIQTARIDVCDEAEVADFFTQLGPLDHLVTAAAGTVRGWVQDLPVSEARALFESKYWGQYHCIKYAAAQLRSSAVLFSGWISRKPMAGVSTLAAVDAAIEALGRTLALELAPRRVNVVTPGMVDTPLWSARLSAAEQAEHFAAIAKTLPVGRAGTPQDIAHAILFLLENNFMTGATLDVDGGQR